jgi:hypothetical protein
MNRFFKQSKDPYVSQVIQPIVNEDFERFSVVQHGATTWQENIAYIMSYEKD